ncbi:MAG: hypothetical protein IPI90_11540 [Saprospiraceae bacterium]|nr:hypothetical protein [Candidatus Vicinibacter affinis]
MNFSHSRADCLLFICKQLFCWMLFCPLSNAQTVILSQEEMHQDLDQLNCYLRKWHPAYYAYASKNEMQEHYSAMKSLCADSMSLREFRNIVRRTVAKVGCGHISVSGRKSAVKGPAIPLIPMRVKIIQDRLFVASCDDSLKIIQSKEEILSIDGRAANEWIELMKDLSLSDGYNQTHKVFSAEKNFAVFMYYLVGQREKFNLVLKNQEALIYEAVLYTKKSQALNELKPDQANSNIIVSGDGVSLEKIENLPNTYLIDLDRFTGKGQKNTYRKIFKKLKSDHCENLIIDLRGNGGGNVFYGNNFLSYLTDQPIHFFTFYRRLSLTPFNPKFKASFLERITPLLFCLNPIQFPGRHGWYHSFPFFKKYKYHYDGKIYVLTNGGTFSMASYVTSHLKHQKQAVVIGEETGGSEFASRGLASGNIELSKSGLRVGLNVYQLTSGLGLKDSGHGVTPDYPLTYQPQDWQQNLDLELRRALELIHNK